MRVWGILSTGWKICMIVHPQKACTPFGGFIVNSSYNFGTFMPNSLQVNIKSVHPNLPDGGYMYISQLAQTEKARFTEHSTILLAALWLVKVSTSFTILLLVNPLALWLVYSIGSMWYQAQRSATEMYLVNWQDVQIRPTYPASHLFGKHLSQNNAWR